MPPAPAKKPCTTASMTFSQNPAATMLSKHNSSSGRPASDKMLVTAAPRIGAIRERRSSMPKIANAKPEHDGQGAGDAAPGQSLLEHDPRQDQPTDRGAGRLNDGAVAERHEHVAKIAPQRERQAAECGQQNAVPPADATEIAEATGGHEGEQYEARPDEPVQRQNQRR